MNMHLAGHSQVGDCLDYDHAVVEAEEAWQLWRTVCFARSLLRIPTLIEWDTDVPDLKSFVS